MLAQTGARFAAVDAVARGVCRTTLKFAVPLVLLAVSGAATPCAAPLAERAHDPADPAARTAGVGYRSTIAPYSSLRPSTPAPWREQNQRVAPSAKPDQGNAR